MMFEMTVGSADISQRWEAMGDSNLPGFRKSVAWPSFQTKCMRKSAYPQVPNRLDRVGPDQGRRSVGGSPP